jgi:hypothetical protein
MNMSTMQMFAAIAMVGVAFLLFYAIRSYMAAQSERRMVSMLERVGLDPAIASSGDKRVIVREIRQRCRSCATEDVKIIPIVYFVRRSDIQVCQYGTRRASVARMVAMQILLIPVVLLFSVAVILNALPLILYIAPVLIVGLIISLIVDALHHRSKPVTH